MPVWGGCEDYLVRSLQIVQNKAARLVCRKGIYTSIKSPLRECNWLSLRQLTVYHSLVLLFKVQKCQQPKYLYGMFTIERRYNTRGEGIGKLDCVSVSPPTQCHWPWKRRTKCSITHVGWAIAASIMNSVISAVTCSMANGNLAVA